MKRLLLSLIAALALPTAVNAEVTDEIHNRCKDVSDYMGCVNANKAKPKEQANPIIRINTGMANGTEEIWYNKDKIQLKYVKNKPNRYIEFDLYAKWWSGGYQSSGYKTPIQANTYSYGNSSTTTITGGQTIGGVNVPAGYRYRYMYTQIDCKDMTFDSKNDDARWHRIGLYKGGRAKAISEVAQEFCGKLTDYPIFTLYGLPTGPA